MPTSKDYFVVFGYVFFVVAVASVAIRDVSRRYDTGVYQSGPGPFAARRMSEFLHLQSELVQKYPKLIYVVGASEIEAAYEPLLVDPLLAKMGIEQKSANVGIRGLHPFFFQLFAENIAKRLKAENKQVDAVMLRVPLDNMTTGFARFSPLGGRVDQMCGLDVSQNWDNIVYRIRAAIHCQFWKETYSRTLFSVWRKAIQDRLNPTLSAFAKYRRIWADPMFLDPDYWNLERRGAIGWNLPESEVAFKQALMDKKDSRVIKASHTVWIQEFGYDDPVFEKASVDSLKATLLELKQVAKRVFIFMTPEGEFVQYHDESDKQRIESLLQEISQETGSVRIQMPDIHNLTPDDYLDFLHLSSSGQIKFYKPLFDFIAPQLKEIE